MEWSPCVSVYRVYLLQPEHFSHEWSGMIQQWLEFMQLNGIWHITLVPYHPASNGLAKWAVQTFNIPWKRAQERWRLALPDFCSTIVQHHIHQLMCPTTSNIHHSWSPACLTTCNTDPAHHQSAGSLQSSIPFIVKRIRSYVALSTSSCCSQCDKQSVRRKIGHDKHVKERQFVLNNDWIVWNFAYKSEGSLMSAVWTYKVKAKVWKTEKVTLKWREQGICQKTNPIKLSRVLTKAKTSLRPRNHRTSEDSTLVWWLVLTYTQNGWTYSWTLVASSVTVQG